MFDIFADYATTTMWILLFEQMLISECQFKEIYFWVFNETSMNTCHILLYPVMSDPFFPLYFDLDPLFLSLEERIHLNYFI